MKTLLVALVLFSSSAFAEAHTFTCKSKDSDDMVLSVNSKTAKLESADPEAGFIFKGKRDLSYKGSKERIRFSGFADAATGNLVMSKELAEGGMEMRNGAMGGFLQMQSTDDGFYTTNYICFAK